ncbi:MAG TPA: NAD(P)H-quinone oxidoreductase [Egibacteraceae bacterium]|nr:NAD(P)H-quinone oxidoreductase [Egibacteraceae bacterium]
MRAVIVRTPGGPDALEIVELPDPSPGPADVLVRVAATALNRADILQREGKYPPPPGASAVLGLELAGEIVAVGAEVSERVAGERVFAVVAGGGYASLAVVPAALAMPIPPPLDVIDAAAVPEAFATAYDNLFNRARLAAGETVLIHGGSSGVGTAAIQLARRAGCRVLITARSERKLAACRDLGAEAGINYLEQDFVAATRELTDGHGADVILDMVGAAYLARNLDALATEGRLAIIGLQKGAAAQVDLSLILRKRITICGSTLRARSTHEKAALARQLEAHVLPGFDDGSLHPVIDRIRPLEQVAEAHRVMEAGEHIGKIVLKVAG